MLNNPQIHLLESYSSEFQAQLRRINAFVKHPSAIGTSHEGILRRFLQKYIPRKFAVSEGFILGTNNEPSNQCDIIIWSHHEYTPFYSEGDFVILPSQAVSVVIEVKTTLDEDALVGSFQNLYSVRAVGDHIYTALFAFESNKLHTLLTQLITKINLECANAINSIYSMQGWILQQSKDIPFRDDPRAVLMETRQDRLRKFAEPLAFTITLPPTVQPLAYGLTEFLACIYMTLGLHGDKIPFHMLPGSSIGGYVFPGRGIQVFSDTLVTDAESNNDPSKGLLTQEFLEKFLRDIRERTQTL